MRWTLLPLCVAGTALALAGCGGQEGGNEAGNNAVAGQRGQAADAGANRTIAAGLAQNSRFFQAAKAAGLDATLAGPGPYTVLVPSDEAFARLPAGALNQLMQPQARGELTRVLTYHILPGTVLVEDIGRAIENANGKAVIATMGGETLTATLDGDRVVLTDSAGTQARMTQWDQQRANGVVHHIDALLMPAAPTREEPAQNTSR